MADEEELKPQAENALNRIDEVLVRTSPQLFQDIPKAKRQEMVKAVVSITKYTAGHYLRLNSSGDMKKYIPEVQN